jgi:hypothetical protein
MLGANTLGKRCLRHRVGDRHVIPRRLGPTTVFSPLLLPARLGLIEALYDTRDH